MTTTRIQPDPRIRPCWCCGVEVFTTVMPVLCGDNCRTDWRQRYQLTYAEPSDILDGPTSAYAPAAIIEINTPLTRAERDELAEQWRLVHAATLHKHASLQIATHPLAQPTQGHPSAAMHTPTRPPSGSASSTESANGPGNRRTIQYRTLTKGG